MDSAAAFVREPPVSAPNNANDQSEIPIGSNRGKNTRSFQSPNGPISGGQHYIKDSDISIYIHFFRRPPLSGITKFPRASPASIKTRDTEVAGRVKYSERTARFHHAAGRYTETSLHFVKTFIRESRIHGVTRNAG